MRWHLRGQRQRWFGHPVLMLAVIAALGLDFWSIPSGSWYGPSTVKREILTAADRVLGRARPTGPRFPSPAYIVHDGNGFKPLWMYTLSPIAGQYTNADMRWLVRRGTEFHNIFFRRHQRHGFYHITTETDQIAFSTSMTPQEQADMAQAYVDGFESIPMNHEVRQWEDCIVAYRLLSSGRWTETTRLPLGNLRNILALTLLLLLIILPARGRTDLWLKTWQDRLLKRRQPWQCPTCSYDTRGLEQCPECGTPVPNEEA